jgi:hypothetical protein
LVARLRLFRAALQCRHHVVRKPFRRLDAWHAVERTEQALELRELRMRLRVLRQHPVQRGALLARRRAIEGRVHQLQQLGTVHR